MILFVQLAKQSCIIKSSLVFNICRSMFSCLKIEIEILERTALVKWKKG